MKAVKSIIPCSVLAVFLFGCSSGEAKTEGTDIGSDEPVIESLEDITAELETYTQVYTIDPTTESTIVGQKGTCIYIPENSFVLQDGSAPKGKVSIELKECYDYSSMIGEDLSTASNGKILETGGMINVRATVDGKELNMADGSAYAIAFPKNGNENEMDLFYDFSYDDSTSTWIEDYKMYEAEGWQSMTEDTVARDEGDWAFTPNYPIEMTDDLYDCTMQWCYLTSTFFDLKVKRTGESIYDYINNPMNSDSAVAKEFMDNEWYIHFMVKIDENGNFYDYHSMRNSVFEDEPLNFTSRTEELAIEYFNNMCPLDVQEYNETNEGDWVIKHDFDYALGVTAAKVLNMQRFKERYRDQYSDVTGAAMSKLGKEEKEYYVFAATNLGWINCDKFWETDDEKIEYFVECEEVEDVQIQIIFKDIKSIMKGTQKDGQFSFINIPENREIKIVGISFANGKTSIATAETTVSEEVFKLTDFTAVSLDELEKELNDLD